MTADVVAFLRAALDEVERVAGAAAECGVDADARFGADRWWQVDPGWSGAVYVNGAFCAVDDGPAAHIALHDPRAALARVQAERAVLHDYERAWAEYAHQDGGVSPAYLSGQMTGAYSAVIALAHGHRHTVPGYDPAWAPEGLEVDA